MKLHFKKTGQGKPIIILHGLLGMLDNWQSVANVLSQNFEVNLLDARNHGHSPHSEIFSQEAMVADLLEFITDQTNINSGVSSGGNGFWKEGVSLIGHSMGGKTAMNFAMEFPQIIRKLMVVDIAPKSYPAGNENIFKALLSVDLSLVKTRREVEGILQQYIPENFVCQFLLKNLYWKESGKLGWRFNLSAIYKNLEAAGMATPGIFFSNPTLFIKGENSEYIKKEDSEAIKYLFPNSEIITIPGAGHWVHADQPLLFVEQVLKFLNE